MDGIAGEEIERTRLGQEGTRDAVDAARGNVHRFRSPRAARRSTRKRRKTSVVELRNGLGPNGSRGIDTTWTVF
jgi:hypothetical protein